MFNSDNYPDRYLVTDTDSILHYEIMEERKYKLEINLIKKVLYFFNSMVLIFFILLSITVLIDLKTK